VELASHLNTPLIAGMIIAVAANAIWIYAKLFVRREGVSFSWFDHFGDFKRLQQLAQSAAPEETREKARRLRRWLWLAIVGFIFAGVPLFFWGALSASRVHP